MPPTDLPVELRLLEVVAADYTEQALMINNRLRLISRLIVILLVAGVFIAGFIGLNLRALDDVQEQEERLGRIVCDVAREAQLMANECVKVDQ